MGGTLLSSMLGLARLQVINAVFGQTSQTGAFFAAMKTPQQLSDLLIGGAVSGALIPIFARYAEPKHRRDLPEVFGALATLAVLVMALAAAFLWVTAPQIVPALNAGFSPHDQHVTLALVRALVLMLPGAGLCAVASALLYALRRSAWPALATGIYHLGVIAAAVGLARRLGIGALPLGVVGGICGQALFLSAAIRRSGVVLRPRLALRHPAVREVGRLYAPIMLSLLASLALQQLDQWLQSRVVDPATGIRGGPSVAALASATTLIQFPAGLVAAALAFAALPHLAQVAQDRERSAQVVRHALALGLALMLPVTVAYLWLSGPIVALLFQHHAFHAADTARTALALRCYAGQLPFLVIEQVALAAWFARSQPRVPLVTGLLSMIAYLMVALPGAPRLGMPALALANAALHAANALLLLGWLALRLPIFPRLRMAWGVIRAR